MRKTRLMSITAGCILALSVILITSSCMFLPPEDSSTLTFEGLSLAWSDEFDGASDAPDSAKWTYDLGGGGWGNNEVQTYTDTRTNSYVSNGTLKIKALKSGSTWTSARLKTDGKYSWKQGYIEARIKLPAGNGVWPAFWMLGDNIGTVGWPKCGEIDVMEYSPATTGVNKVFGTVHYATATGTHDYRSLGEKIDSTVTTAFHTYGVKWTSTEITLYIDGQKIGTPFKKMADTPWPFDQNFFIILNIAMGGNLGGTIDSTLTQAIMEVDYIRVYQ
ncbi:glycoside hydrolase family 16 protein [Gracilinema caldarium]|uniref:glycoside hydrolase family 16 protein n=1 Tax=Gracilinema caldarium TaxID=215591 RepID=UPI0026F25B87|nr:glycoside hydrolase family 16 protein [Gracilinema caldarium]